MSLESPTFVAARYFTKTNGRNIRLQILHTMQAPEKPNTAEAVANWWHGATSPKTSAHYCYDSDSEVQCVRDQDVAYAAPGANHDGLHHELSGYAQQSMAEWKDPFSLAMLARCARRVSDRCDLYGHPKTWLSDREVEVGREGITHHAVVSRVYKRSSHWDVGPNFPVDFFIDLVRAAPLLSSAPAQNGQMTIMMDARRALQCPIDGGFQKLQSDGAVFNADGCDHYHGSWFENTPIMIEARKNQPDLPFTDLVRVEGGNGTNYVIMRSDGAIYGPDFGYGIG